MITLRDYQIESVSSIYNYFATKAGNPVVAMPTGTGKSLSIAAFAESAMRQWPSTKIIILTHVKELIKQNYETLLAYWPFAPAGIYSAGLNRRDRGAPITFAGIASVATKWAMFGHIDLVLIDEAHLLSPSDSSMYQKFLTGLKSINPNIKVVGFTATPWRLGHGHIADGELFDEVCFDITTVEAFNRLIAEGYMSTLIPRNTKTILSTDGVHVRGGEFIQGELQQAVDKNSLTEAAVREALELGHDRNHWLIFASGVDHAVHIAEMMQHFGQSCIAVHSKMDSKDRDSAIQGFKDGSIRAIVNNNILTTGFDSPWVDMILCLRPTASPVLWVQMLGRGTRPFKGNVVDPIVKKNCLVLDFAGNTRRLGPINDPVAPKKKGAGGGEAPVKLCPVCDTWNHASVRWCIHCANEFTFETKLKQESSTAVLIKGDMPKVEVFKVDHITYRKHTRIGKPDMLKANYYCNLRMFEEFICLEHTGFAQKKARDWWRARTSDPVPTTIAEALAQVQQIPAATHLRVWVNKQYPEILATCLDGTGFGAHAPIEDLPQVELYAGKQTPTEKALSLDDDIPF